MALPEETMSHPKEYHFKLPPYQGPPIAEPPNAWYPNVKAHHNASTSARTDKGDGTVRAFVIHATAGASSSGAMSVMFAHSASWHWLIPDENEPEHGKHIWACAPEKRAAWHVRSSVNHPDVNEGKNNINAWSLGVEIVNTQVGDPFSEWQVEQTAALVRYAWAKYPTLVDVLSHAKLDPTRRTDPGTTFPWDKFKALVLAPPPVFAPNFESWGPLQILGPDGAPIDCNPRIHEGVTMVEARLLLKALGFDLVRDPTSPRTLRIRGRTDGLEKGLQMLDEGDVEAALEAARSFQSKA